MVVSLGLLNAATLMSSKPITETCSRNTETKVLKRANGTDGRSVIEGHKSGELSAAGQELLHHRVAQLGGEVMSRRVVRLSPGRSQFPFRAPQQ